MKKPYIWSGISGALIVLINLGLLVNYLGNPTDLLKVNIAQAITAIAWILFGLSLIWLFVKGKNIEEKGYTTINTQPDTPEDTKRWENNRNWVVSIFIIVLTFASIGTWVVNDYYAGPTLVNINVIFDLFISLVILVLAIALLFGKKVLNYILYAIITMVVVEAVLAYMRTGWMEAATVVLIVPYFAYAILVKQNRQNFRIANYIVLPLSIIFVVVLTGLSGSNLNAAIKQELQDENQLINQDSVAGQAYSNFLQGDPSPETIEDVTTDMNASVQTIHKIFSDILQIKSIYSNQMPSIQQQEALYHIVHYSAFLNLNLEQAQAIENFMLYASTLKFTNLSSAQKTKINTFVQQINNYSTKIANASYVMSNDAGVSHQTN